MIDGDLSVLRKWKKEENIFEVIVGLVNTIA